MFGIGLPELVIIVVIALILSDPSSFRELYAPWARDSLISNGL